jgi:hypothetical protein
MNGFFSGKTSPFSRNRLKTGILARKYLILTIICAGKGVDSGF